MLSRFETVGMPIVERYFGAIWAAIILSWVAIFVIWFVVLVVIPKYKQALQIEAKAKGGVICRCDADCSNNRPAPQREGG